jgi:hypothetical protein
MVKEIKNYIPLGKNRYPSGKKKTPRTQKNKKPPYVYTFSASTLKEITALGIVHRPRNRGPLIHLAGTEPQKKGIFASVFHPRVHLLKCQWTRFWKATFENPPPTAFHVAYLPPFISRVIVTKSWLRTMIFLLIVLRMMACHHTPCLLCLRQNRLILRWLKKSSKPPPILPNTST